MSISKLPTIIPHPIVSAYSCHSLSNFYLKKIHVLRLKYLVVAPSSVTFVVFVVVLDDDDEDVVVVLVLT